MDFKFWCVSLIQNLKSKIQNQQLTYILDFGFWILVRFANPKSKIPNHSNPSIYFDTLKIIPNAIQVNNILVPPMEIRGRLSPVAGTK